jgi:CTP synthase
MHAQKSVEHKGASMRLGSYRCDVVSGTHASRAYKKKVINERHRHRYEFNNKYKKQLVKAGLKVSGINKKLKLVEMIEFPSHPWFVGVQFHPELKSTVVNVHPLFRDFIHASVKYRDEQ